MYAHMHTCVSLCAYVWKQLTVSNRRSSDSPNGHLHPRRTQFVRQIWKELILCRFLLKFIYTTEGKTVVISFWGEILQIQTKKPLLTLLFDSFVIISFFKKLGSSSKTDRTIKASADKWITILHLYKRLLIVQTCAMQTSTSPTWVCRKVANPLRCYFIEQLYTTATFTKWTKLSGRAKKKSKPSQTLPWGFFLSLQGLPTAHSHISRRRAQEYRSWQTATPAIWTCPVFYVVSWAVLA